MTTGTVVWPKLLVEALARSECVLFIGAGFTKNAEFSSGNPPVTWSELLLKLLEEIAPKAASGRWSANAQPIAGQIQNGDLLWAAQALEELFRDAGRQTDFKSLIASAVDGPRASPFQPGRPHQALVSLDARTLVTTNYDKVLERLFGAGYTYLPYTGENIAECIRTGRPVILKLHGTVDDPNRMVITRLNFAELRSSGNRALQIVEALALTRTVLFLGYGLDDPDLQLILENQMRASGSAPGHYLLAHKSSVTGSRQEVMREAFGVELIQYRGDRVSGFAEALEALVGQVEAERAARLGH